MRRIAVFNGPNLNMLGRREPELYGSVDLETINQGLASLCESHGYQLLARQTNAEAELIGWIQECGVETRGVVLNPAAFTHTSIALRDAVLMIAAPVVEVHLTNTRAREAFRHHSVIADVVWGRIEGLGAIGYDLAVRALIAKDSSSS
ncbi:type II 3-dehydroquinate dehydratase [bacterium]|nr:type II 3-dehydroquinate dehydratase [candidate division CSSED10-310 bacterium]